MAEQGCHAAPSAQACPPRTASMACAAFRSSLDALIITDRGGTILLASNSVKPVLGWDPDELVGRSAGVLVPESHRTLHEAGVRSHPGAGPSPVVGRTQEVLARRKDGANVPVELTVSRFTTAFGEEMLCAVLHDISQRKAAEAELEEHRRGLEQLVRERTRELEESHAQLQTADRLAVIGTLAAGLGHDMNNVLLPVRSRLNALLATPLPAPWRDHVEDIRKSVSYLQQLADGLHYLALDPARENTSTATHLSRWWELSSALLSKAVPRHVRVVASISETLPAVGVAPHSLTQAMLNLLVNAGEAIPPGRKRRQGIVRVAADPSQDGASVTLSVTDNGRGMSDEVRRRAVEMFFTTKTRGLGTGLGLPLVRRVAESAGGRLEIESQPGRGTTIRLHLPVAGPSASAARANRWRAAVTVHDSRAAALIEQFLLGAGVEVSRRDEPGDAGVWVLSHSSENAARAHAWLADNPDRRLILLGPPGSGPPVPGAVTITDIKDINALRATLGRALSRATDRRTGHDGPDRDPRAGHPAGAAPDHSPTGDPGGPGAVR